MSLVVNADSLYRIFSYNRIFHIIVFLIQCQKLQACQMLFNCRVDVLFVDNATFVRLVEIFERPIYISGFISGFAWFNREQIEF